MPRKNPMKHDFPLKCYIMKIYKNNDAGEAELESPTKEEVEVILGSDGWKLATRGDLKLKIERTGQFDRFLIRPKDGQYDDEPEIIEQGWDPEDMLMGYYQFNGYSPYLTKNGIEYCVSMIACS